SGNPHRNEERGRLSDGSADPSADRRRVSKPGPPTAEKSAIVPRAGEDGDLPRYLLQAGKTDQGSDLYGLRPGNEDRKLHGDSLRAGSRNADRELHDSRRRAGRQGNGSSGLSDGAEGRLDDDLPMPGLVASQHAGPRQRRTATSAP